MKKETILKQPVATLFLGGLVGTGAALLFSPVSGKQTRQRITGLASDIKGRAQCYTLRGKEAIFGAARRGKDYFEERKSLIAASIEGGRKAYAKEKERRRKAH